MPFLNIKLQGLAKRLRPGLVNMRRKNCILLPALLLCDHAQISPHIIVTHGEIALGRSEEL